MYVCLWSLRGGEADLRENRLRLELGTRLGIQPSYWRIWCVSHTLLYRVLIDSGEQNDSFSETGGILKGTMRRMNKMAKRQGGQWCYCTSLPSPTAIISLTTSRAQGSSFSE